MSRTSTKTPMTMPMTMPMTITAIAPPPIIIVSKSHVMTRHHSVTYQEENSWGGSYSKYFDSLMAQKFR